MDADRISLRFPQLIKASEDIGITVASMNSELDTLKQTITPMVATWEGGAQAAYFARQTEWEKAAADLNILLAQIKQAVIKSAEMMQHRDNYNAGLFHG